MKGQGGAIAVVIIVVVLIGVFVYFSQAGGISLPGGGVATKPITYSNDVITVTDKFVSDKTPRDGQKTTIDFVVRNNGRGEVENVKIKLEPTTGFASTVKCGDAAAGSNECTVNLEEGDATDVLITLQADIKGINQIIPSNVRYSVSYTYSGEREAHIPIVADRDNLPKGQTFFTGDSTIGPLQISFTTPPARPTSDGGAAVYALAGTLQASFPLEFRVENVGGGGVAKVEKVFLKGDQLTIETSANLQIEDCDKVDAQTKSLVKKEDPVEKEKSGEEVPLDVECSFLPTLSGGEVADGVVKVKLNNYNYKISMSDTFHILPKDLRGIDISEILGEEVAKEVAEEEIEELPEAAPSEGAEEEGAAPAGTQMTLSTDKGIYKPSETVIITGTVPGEGGATVTGKVFNPSGSLVHIFQAQTTITGAYSTNYVLASKAPTGAWRIVAKWGSLEREVAISVV